MNSIRKKYIRWLGNALSLLGVAFVAYTMKGNWDAIAELATEGKFVLMLAIGTGLWIAVNMLLGIGWSTGLRLVHCYLPAPKAVLICMRTQVAKYVPGNVFHLVNRTLLLSRFGAELKVATTALALESAVLVSLAGFVALLYFLNITNVICTVLGSASAVILVIGLAIRSCRILFTKIRFQEGRKFWLILTLTVMAYAGVLVAQGGIFSLIVHGSSSAEISLGFGELFAMATIAWVAGYLVVGSPGGLGVREGVFSLFVLDDAQMSELAFAMIVLRIVSTLGDLMSWSLSVSGLRDAVSSSSDSAVTVAERRTVKPYREK